MKQARRSRQRQRPALLFAKLIRDADKLDIYRVVLRVHRQYRADPADPIWNLEMSDAPMYSPEVLDAAMNGTPVEYSMLRVLNDVMLCKLGWVYDMNFAASLARLRELGFLEEVLSLLPATPEIERLGEKTLSYVNARVHLDVR